MRLYPQKVLMLTHDTRLIDKVQGQEIKEKEGARREKTQLEDGQIGD